MRKLLAYFLGLFLFTFLLGMVNRFVPGNEQGYAETVPIETGTFNEISWYDSQEAPGELLLPSANLLQAMHRRPVQSALSFGFTPSTQYITFRSSSDYKDDYRQRLTVQQDLVPIIDPSLEYVYLLRRILI